MYTALKKNIIFMKMGDFQEVSGLAHISHLIPQSSVISILEKRQQSQRCLFVGQIFKTAVKFMKGGSARDLESHSH